MGLVKSKVEQVIEGRGVTDWSGVLRYYTLIKRESHTGVKTYGGELQPYLADEEARVVQDLLVKFSYRNVQLTKDGIHVTFTVN